MEISKTKVLVIVEGAKTDYKLMQHLFNVYGLSNNHEIISYNTNIYTLYNQMFRNQDPSSLDILQVLKEREPSVQKQQILEQNFSDILLIFDLDPQDPQFSFQKITAMVEYFSESTDMGKLYLNYPMVESFYHMKSIPDPNYFSRLVTLQELKLKIYKKRVHNENRDHDQRKFAKEKQECNIVIKQNIEKALKITNQYFNPNILNLPPAQKIILVKQLKQFKNSEELFVLCTCIFYIYEYNPLLLN